MSMTLDDLANLASLATFVVGVGAYLWYRYEFRRKSKRLEHYLRAEKAKGEDQGQRTAL
jgi:hypothetical protein